MRKSWMRRVGRILAPLLSDGLSGALLVALLGVGVCFD